MSRSITEYLFHQTFFLLKNSETNFFYIEPRTVSWMQLWQMHFVSLWKFSAVLWILPWLSRENRSGLHGEKQTQMIFLVQALKFYGTAALWSVKGQGLDMPKLHSTTMVKTRILYHSTTSSEHTFTQSSFLVSTKTFHFPNSKGKSNCWQNGPFALYWPHLNKHPQSPHTTFTAGLPHSIQILLGESTMSSLIQQNACPI